MLVSLLMDILTAVVRLETTLWNLLDKELARSGSVGLATFLALQTFHRHDGKGRVNDLSRELAITVGAASKVVDRLERSGLARRSPHPDDRRSSLVALTAEGDRARSSANQVVERVLERVFADATEVDAALALVGSLQQRLDDRAEVVS